MANSAPTKPNTPTIGTDTKPADTTPAQTPESTPAPVETETEKKTTRKRAPEVAFTQVTIDPTAFEEREPESAGKRRSKYMTQLIEFVEQHFKSGAPAGLECDADEATVKALETKIRSAANVNKRGIRFGAFVKSPNPGKVYVTFKVVERVSKPRKPKTDA